MLFDIQINQLTKISKKPSGVNLFHLTGVRGLYNHFNNIAIQL